MWSVRLNGMVILCIFTTTLSFRVFDVDLNDRIRHYLVETTLRFNRTEEPGPSSSFLDICQKNNLALPFPLFLCPLMFLTSKEEQLGFTRLYNSTASAVSEINDLKNHPCNHQSKSSLIVFLPDNHILTGCIDFNLFKSTPSNQQFMYDFVVSHNVTSTPSCQYDTTGQPMCTMDSIMVEGFILLEDHSCCCDSGYCAVVIYDQPETIVPLVRSVVDLKDVQSSISARRRRKRSIATDSSTSRTEAKRAASEEMEPPMTSSSIASFSYIIPIFLFVVVAMLGTAVWSLLPNENAEDLAQIGVRPNVMKSMTSVRRQREDMEVV